jgi:radical SAM superfamily enzyme YgiQ (UPF0313 family)
MTLSWLTTEPVRRFAAAVHSHFRAKIIVGGPLATAAPNLALEIPEFDLVAVGDGETIARRLCIAMDRGAAVSSVPGILARADKADWRRAERQVADVRRINMPAWDLVSDFERYSSPDALRLPLTIVEAQRGCPHCCAFCSLPSIRGRKRRARPVHQIIEELTYLRVARGVREISFVDPEFTIDRQYAQALCKSIRSEGLDVSWFCNVRADSITEELAETIRSAGCHTVYLGLESGDPDTLRIIGKRTSLDTMRAAVATLRKAAIKVSAGFIIGFPFDTDQSVRRTIDFAKELLPDAVQFSIFNWFPGVAIERPALDGATGFHPREEGSRWCAWQKVAYHELDKALGH